MRARRRFRFTDRHALPGVIPDGVVRGALLDAYIDPILHGDRRLRRILESLRSEIVEAGAGSSLRIRRVFQTPREIYRLELELPELAYQRTTLLDREALEELLASDGVEAAVRASALGS